MKKLLFAISIALMFSCNEQNNKTVPEKQSIENLRTTDFVATLENSILEEKNYIYSPTLAIAWNEIQNKLGSIQIAENKDNKDLVLLNTTNSNLNSLVKDEYTSNVSISGDEIIAKTGFILQINFKPFLEKFQYPLLFKNVEVDGFGMIEWDVEKADQLEIVYFKDNNNFIFKLNPKNSNNELIFIRGLGSVQSKSFKDVTELYNVKIALGKEEIKDKKQQWKYQLFYDETFEIPELAFNLEKSFRNMEGQTFSSHNVNYSIGTMRQRNALILNNEGAKIESEAEVLVAALEDNEEPKHIKKRLILNNTFFLIIKHKDKKNPFFCAKIDNTELMSKHGKKSEK